MTYVGSKRRIAPQIKETILKNTTDRSLYVEPFCGGMNSFSVVAPAFEAALASDSHEDLILMWRAALAGMTFPADLTEQQYHELRTSDPSAIRGFAGFSSYGGKFFGGYARSRKTVRNFRAESARAIYRQVEQLKDTSVTVECCSYDRLDIPKGAVVYCDPPYVGTLGYGSSFDHERFWSWAQTLSRTNPVFVSEYAAPEGWAVMGEFALRQSVSSATSRGMRTERLFRFDA